MSDARGPKEVAFDERIRHHLDAIQVVCDEAKINFVTYFALDLVMPNALMQSRTVVVNDKTDRLGAFRVQRLWEVILGGETAFEDSMSPDGSGN